VNANAPAFDGANSQPRIGSRAQWERGMAIAAAVPPVVAEDHGRECGGHDGVVFLLVLCFMYDIVLAKKMCAITHVLSYAWFTR